MKEKQNNFKITSSSILYSLPLIGTLGILLPLIMGQSNLALLGSYLAIPMITAPIIYNVYRKRDSTSIELGGNAFKIFLISYFICISISICILYTYDSRPVLYYLMITLIGSIILFEILVFKDSTEKTLIVIIQLMILVLCILWSVNLNYYYYIARTDPIFHVSAIEFLIDNFHISETVFDIYKPFPLWHILCATVHHISPLNLPIQKTMFFTSGIIYSFTPVLMYSISNKIVCNSKISLISALFVVINPDVIIYGMASLPRSIVSFLFLLLILSRLSMRNMRMMFVSIFLIIPVVMYHTASAPFILMILLLISIGEYIYNNDEINNFSSLKYILLFMLVSTFYWMFYAELLFEALILAIVKESPSGVLTDSIIYTPFNELFNYIHYSPMLFFIIIGALTALNTNKIISTGKIFCLIGLLSVAVVFPGPALLINKLAGDFNLGRFGQYFYPFISIAFATGFVFMYEVTKKHSRAIVICVTILLIFLSVSNDFVASDNPIVKRPFYTYYLTEQEITSFNTIGQFASGYMMSDYVTSRYLLFANKPYSSKRHIAEINPADMSFLREKNEDIFIIRHSELSKRPLKFYTNTEGSFILAPSWEGGVKMDYYYSDLNLWGNIETYNKIYNAKSTQCYI